MKIKLLLIAVFALTPFVFSSVDAGCEKNMGSSDESCTPAELLVICSTLWSLSSDESPTPGNIFCNAVYDLDLNVNDVAKLGIYLDWQNYAMQSSKEFVDDWGFYQDHAIPDTLVIHPSISMRDSLPPAMTVRISFDYVDESETKRFDESLRIYMKYDPEIITLPENTWVIMPREEPKPPIMSDEQQDVMLQYCEMRMRHPDMVGIPQCIKNEPSCDPNSELVDGICVVIDGGCEPDINNNTTWCGPSYDYLKIILSEPSAFLFAFGIPFLIAGIVIGIMIWRKRK